MAAGCYPVGGSALLRALDEPLGELAATSLGIEADHEAVVVDVGDRAAGLGAVGAGADCDRDLTVGGDGAVVGVVGAGLVGRRGVGMVALPEPGLDHRIAAADRSVVGVVAVLDLLGEKGADRLAVVRLPRLDVGLEPLVDVRS